MQNEFKPAKFVIFLRACVIIFLFALLVDLFGSLNCYIVCCIKLQMEIANGGASRS